MLRNCTAVDGPHDSGGATGDPLDSQEMPKHRHHLTPEMGLPIKQISDSGLCRG